jgi:thiaminase (transcriptional activator TenA)
VSGAEGSLCAELRAGSDAIWASLHEHPFVRELAAGTLPLERFRFYLEQNLMYLPEYARAIALGAARAGDVDELGRFSDALASVVAEEIPKDRELLARVIELGAEDRGGARAMAPATLAYTSFLLSTAYRAGPLEILTAIMPCAWSYGEIADRLRDRIAPHPVYAGWVGFFAGGQYEDVVRELRAQLDARATGLPPSRRRELALLFDMAGRLEHGFWDMAYGLVQWPDLA